MHFLSDAFWPLHGQQKSCADFIGQIFDMQLAVCCPTLSMFQQITGIAKVTDIGIAIQVYEIILSITFWKTSY